MNPPEERETDSGGSGSEALTRERNSRDDPSITEVTDQPDSAAVDFTSRYRSSSKCKVVVTSALSRSREGCDSLRHGGVGDFPAGCRGTRIRPGHEIRVSHSSW